MRERVIRKGPTQITVTYPRTNGRSSNEFLYTKQIQNGEQVKRKWLVYSQVLDAIFLL